MTYWAHGGSVKGKINTPGVTSLDILAPIAGPGPFAKDIVPLMGPSIILGNKAPKLEMQAKFTQDADAFGLDPVLFVADNASELFGTWGLNATGDDEIKAWEATGGAGAPWGYYKLIYNRMPSADIIVKFWPAMSDKFKEDLKQFQPTLWNEVRTKLGYTDTVPGAEPVAGPSLPPGPEGFTKPGGDAGGELLEFSVDAQGDGLWVARTPQLSAAGNEDNPHKGISIINPGAWEKVAAGMTPQEAMSSLTDYADRGWTGLWRKFLAWQQGTSTVQPAGEELASAMDAAEAGDAGAWRALRASGINYKGAPAERKPSDILEALGL